MSGPDKGAIAKPPRELACSRCRRRKKRCNKARPVCGECQKAGAECLLVGTQKAGKFATVPIEYLESLEARVAELEGALQNNGGATTSMAALQSHIEHRHALPSPPGSRTSQDLGHIPSFDANQSFQGIESLQGFSPDITQTSPSQPEQLSTCRRPVFDDGFHSMLRGDAGKDALASLIPQENAPFIVEYYANVYFTNVHLPWPCLDKPRWLEWYKTWKGAETPESDRWQGFFLDMVYAIGALYCSAFDKVSQHTVRARRYFKRALTHHRYAMRQGAMTRAKASLMMVLYTLHDSSPAELYTQITTAMLHCTNAVDEEAKKKDELSSSEKSLNQLTAMTCHNLNEVIAQGWERPASFTYSTIEKKFYEKLDEAVSLPSNPQADFKNNCCQNTAAFDHVYMLRRLRSKARHAKAAETDFESFRNNEIRLKLRRAMDEWKAKIPEVADSTVHSEYYGQEWMSHLYDYALIDLLHAPRHSLTVEDLQELLSAACRGLKTFVACREEKHITCYTLTALVYQFRAGIILIYCLWALPANVHLSSELEDAYAALKACSKTLSQFALRWDDATIYRDAFNFLARTTIPQSPFYIQNPIAQQHAAAKALVRELRRLHTHRPVVQMIEEMCFQQQTPQVQTSPMLDNSTASPLNLTTAGSSSPTMTTGLETFYTHTATSNTTPSPLQTTITTPTQTQILDFQPHASPTTAEIESMTMWDSNAPSDSLFQDMLNIELDVDGLNRDFFLGSELPTGSATGQVDAEGEIGAGMDVEVEA